MSSIPDGVLSYVHYIRTVDEAEALYSSLYHARVTQGYTNVDVVPGSVGSPLSQQQRTNSAVDLDTETIGLLRFLYAEAQSRIQSSIGGNTCSRSESSPAAVTNISDISTPLGALPLSQIEEAEAVLVQLLNCINTDGVGRHELIKKLRTALPITTEMNSDICTADDVGVVCVTCFFIDIQYMDICQLLRDSVAVSEEFGVSSGRDIDRMYRTLHTTIRQVDPTDPAWDLLSGSVASGCDSGDIMIKSVWSATRSGEAHKFDPNNINNNRLLVHATCMFV